MVKRGIINTDRLSCEVPVILVVLERKLNLLDNFFKKN